MMINTCPTSPYFTNSTDCGPWLPIDGAIYGYTTPQYGLATQPLWNGTIPGLLTFQSKISVIFLILDLIVSGNITVLATFYIGHLKISATTSIYSVLRAGKFILLPKSL